MKKLLALLLAALMAFSLFACSNGSNNNTQSPEPSQSQPAEPSQSQPVESQPVEADPIELNIAYMANWGALWAVATADAKGYFAEEGLKLNLSVFDNGPNEIAAMESGSIDISYIGPGAHKLCSTGNAEVILLQHLGDGDCIIGLNGISSIEELRGKKVGYAAGTSSETILSTALASVGMTMDDVELYNMSANNMTTAAIGGEVDALAVWSPTSLNILANVEGSVDICSNVDFAALVSPGSWVVNPTWADNNEEVIVKFLRAMYKGMDYAAAATTDDAIANEVAGYIAAIIASDVETVIGQRYDGTWMTSAQMKEMLDNGSLVQVYVDQQSTFIANGALEENGNLAADDFVLTGLMSQAFGN